MSLVYRQLNYSSLSDGQVKHNTKAYKNIDLRVLNYQDPILAIVLQFILLIFQIIDDNNNNNNQELPPGKIGMIVVRVKPCYPVGFFTRYVVSKSTLFVIPTEETTMQGWDC